MGNRDRAPGRLPVGSRGAVPPAVVLVLAALFASAACASRTPQLLAEGDAPAENFDVTLETEPRTGLFVVPVKVGDREAHFLLDSGAPTAVTPALRRALALSTRSRTRAVDARGTETEVDVVRLPPTVVGGVPFADISAVVLDLERVPELRCLGVEGLLGANLMRQAAWRFDLGNGRVRFASDLATLGYPAGAPAARFITLDSGSPLLRPVLDGRPVDDTVLDTGADVGLVAPARILTPAEQARAVEVVGSSGAAALGYGPLDATGWFARVESIVIGELRLGGRAVEFRRETSLLGTRFLRDYRVTVDWRSRRVWFEPASGNSAPSSGFGFDVLMGEGGLLVAHVIVETPAWEAGLRPGQRLLSLDDEPVAALEAARYCEIRERGLAPGNDRVRVRWLEEGRERIAELERITVSVF